MYGRLTSVCWAEESSNLGFLGGIFQTLQSQLVVAQVDALLTLELVYQIVDDAVVEVFTTQVGVTVGRQYFEGGFAFNFVESR